MRTVSPRPSRFARSHSRPRATDFTHSVTLTNLFNAGLTLQDAETSGRLHIGGDRTLAVALLDKLTTWRALLAEARAHAVGR